MSQIINIVFIIFIALAVYINIRSWLKSYAFASTSDSQVSYLIRSLFYLVARTKALEYIIEYTKGYGPFSAENHRVRDIMYYDLELDKTWFNNFKDWGWSECESVLSDRLDRVREFVKEWTDENPFIYSSQLEQIWKVHKGSYMSRGNIPNVPTQLRPQQQ